MCLFEFATWRSCMFFCLWASPVEAFFWHVHKADIALSKILTCGGCLDHWFSSCCWTVMSSIPSGWDFPRITSTTTNLLHEMKTVCSQTFWMPMFGAESNSRIAFSSWLKSTCVCCCCLMKIFLTTAQTSLTSAQKCIEFSWQPVILSCCGWFLSLNFTCVIVYSHANLSSNQCGGNFILFPFLCKAGLNYLHQNLLNM